MPQPAPDFEPFDHPLAHMVCLITAYSESVKDLFTTHDSLVTTGYPNSHKLILVIEDGMVKSADRQPSTATLLSALVLKYSFRLQCALPTHRLVPTQVSFNWTRS